MNQAKRVVISLVLLACAPWVCADMLFSDDFNRPNGSVGNGWVGAPFNAVGNLVILGGKLTSPAEPSTGSRASIYRPVDASAGISASATLTETNGNKDPRRYESAFWVGNNMLYRWFVGLAIDSEVWDHSSFTRNGPRPPRRDRFMGV